MSSLVDSVGVSDSLGEPVPLARMGVEGEGEGYTGGSHCWEKDGSFHVVWKYDNINIEIYMYICRCVSLSYP